MINRRTKRSEQPDEALQLLLEALVDRSDVRAVALVDERQRVLAGVGMPYELRELRQLAGPVGRGESCPAVDALDESTDVFSRPVAMGGATVYLAALGTRLRRFGEAAAAVTRIAATSGAL